MEIVVVKLQAALPMYRYQSPLFFGTLPTFGSHSSSAGFLWKEMIG
jgi:hypothetical protein